MAGTRHRRRATSASMSLCLLEARTSPHGLLGTDRHVPPRPHADDIRTNAQLSRALANFMFNARSELERACDFNAEYLLRP